MPALRRLVSSSSRLLVPLGLVALVAAGVHAGADRLDDLLLTGLDGLDAWLDAWLGRWSWTQGWVHLVESPQRTLLARALALGWELAVDVLVALPLLTAGAPRVAPWARLRRQPTPMRVLRPLEAGLFALGGAAAVARLVEGTAFQGLHQGVAAPAAVAAALASVLGVLALGLVVVSHGTRAVWGALQHADAVCEAAPPGRARWLAGAWGSALALPLAVALALDVRALLAVLR